MKYKTISTWSYVLFCCLTSIICYHKEHDLFYAILAWLFAPITWIYWLVTQQINITIIHDSFSFFFK